MLLNFEVGARVKLAPGHDHKLMPGYSLVSQNITAVQRDKLSSSGPMYGAVTRVCPDKCAYEVNINILAAAAVLGSDNELLIILDPNVRSANTGRGLVAGCCS